MARFAHARHDVDAPALALDRDQIRRRAHVEIPDVVSHVLKVPEPFPGQHVERKDAVAEQIVTEPADADHVGPRRTERDERDAALVVDRQAAPAVRAHLRIVPGIGPELIATRNRMEAPELRARPDVKRVDVARHPRGDEHMLVHGARRRRPSRQRRAATLAEARDRRARLGIDRVNPIARTEKNARRVVPIAGPVDEPASGGQILRPVLPCFHRPAPLLHAGRRVDRHDRLAWRRSVEHAVHNDRRALDIRGAIAGAISPCHLEVAHVLARDLSQAGVTARAVLALRARPAGEGFRVDRRRRREFRLRRRRDDLELRLGRAGGRILERRIGALQRNTQRQSKERAAHLTGERSDARGGQHRRHGATKSGKRRYEREFLTGQASAGVDSSSAHHCCIGPGIRKISAGKVSFTTTLSRCTVTF